MKILLFLAKKYIFSQSYRATLRAIRWAAFLGIATSFAISWIVLSAFNGIEQTVIETQSRFQSDFKIQHKTQKYFHFLNQDDLEQKYSFANFSPALEENILLEYQDYQQTTTLKGITENFLNHLEKTTTFIGEKNEFFVYLGRSLWDQLRYHPQAPLTVWSLVEPVTQKKELQKKLRQYPLWVDGYFLGTGAPNQEIWMEYHVASKVLGLTENTVSSIEVLIQDVKKSKNFKEQLHAEFGEDFLILDTKAQNAFFYKISQSEKWISFIFLTLLLVMASFSVLILQILMLFEKQNERKTLNNLGFSTSKIYLIFVFSGTILSNLAAISGLILAYILLNLQIQFHFLPFQSGWIDYFPFAVSFSDAGFVFIVFNILLIFILFLPRKYFLTFPSK